MWKTAVAGAAAAAAAGTVWYVYKLNQPTDKDPPCPGSDFLIGSVRHFGRPPLHISLSEKFGNEPVVLLFLGCTRLYILNTWPAFNEAMIDNADALSGRVSQKAATLIFGDAGGLVASEGELWRKYRRFSLQTLRDFGLGRRGAEHCIITEVEDLCSELGSKRGEGVDIEFLLGRNVSNVICQLVFGSRLASESEEFSKILDTFNRVTANPEFQESNFKSMAYLPLTERFESVLKLLLMLPQAKSSINMIQYLMDFCQLRVKEHQAEMQEGAEARDYIDAHLKHQASQPEIFNDTRLTMAILDLFIAGTETTSNTLRWAMLLMIAYPSVALKVHEEVVEAAGSARLPSVADKSKLPFTQAVLEEIHRFVSLVPLGVAHRTMQDVKISGFTVPANSLVMYNTYNIHRDPIEFPDPNQFKPERHLDDQGHFRPNQRIIAFGAGRRACLGESLARMELLLFFASLMQRFRFELDPASCANASAMEMLQAREKAVSTLTRVAPPFRIVPHFWSEAA